MEDQLISEEEYQELLAEREKPLTAAQRRELREIDRTAMQMSVLSTFDEVEDAHEIISGDVWQSLRNQQIEILSNEKRGILEALASFVPDKIGPIRIG